MKYFTRSRVKRFYEWRGDPSGFNRKLRTVEYGSSSIRVEGLPRTTVIKTGQHISIEGEDDDNPYVAKVVRSFADESGEQKKAVVQWFVRVSEVPPGKSKSSGRDPHPQEIFFYEGHNCDDEVNAESILRPVQVKHSDAAAPFPDSDDGETLYVKLSWDSRTFRVVEPPRPPHPSLPPSPPRSPPAATPTSRGPGRRALPTPDPAVMRRAASGDGRLIGAAASAGKAAAAEAESLHSVTKSSASKCLSAKRRSSTERTPGVRKKSQLCGPDEAAAPGLREDISNRSSEEESESNHRSASASSSPPSSPALTHSLTPLRRTNRKPGAHDGVASQPSSVGRRRGGSQSEADSPGDDPTRTTDRTTTPSRKKEAQTAKEPASAVSAEEESEDVPTSPVGATPRSSRRKSASKVSSRIKKQSDLSKVQRESSSDEDEEDEFVPSRKESQSSSEEEEEEEDEEAGSESEEEVVAKKSRSSSSAASRTQKTRSSTRTPRKTPRKTTPGTPRTPRHATPSIPSRSQPARRPANVSEEARTRLHVSSVPESSPCREQEFQDIYNFVESKITDGTGGCMYISGVPGTGKTATVHEVMRCSQNAADADEIPAFRFVEINGMKMTDPHQAYVQILQKSTGQKATADHAASSSEKRFSNPAPRKETTVSSVDELDSSWTRKQNVMYNSFDWPTRRHARSVVSTIANTMDSPERIMINRVASRSGSTRMSFQPYTFKQSQQIITSRSNKVKAFEEDASQSVSRKVAASSGDARRCLDICRRATEICEHSAADPTAAGLVGMSHVMEASDEMFSSAYITAIKCASTQEQLFSRAVIAEFRRSGLEEATFQQVFVQHQASCRVEGSQPIGVSEGSAVCQRSGACRSSSSEPSRSGVSQRVRLNVSQDDVLFASKAD